VIHVAHSSPLQKSSDERAVPACDWPVWLVALIAEGRYVDPRPSVRSGTMVLVGEEGMTVIDLGAGARVRHDRSGTP
jgi:hypothetical protein